MCKIYGPDAVFLQQACHLTSGSYYRLARRAGLLQYLIVRTSFRSPRRSTDDPTPRWLFYRVRSLGNISPRRRKNKSTCEQRVSAIAGLSTSDTFAQSVFRVRPPRVHPGQWPLIRFLFSLLLANSRVFDLSVSRSVLPSAVRMLIRRCSTKFPMSTLMRLGAGSKIIAPQTVARPPRKRKAGDAIVNPSSASPAVASPSV